MEALLDIAFPGTRLVTKVRGGDINETFLVKYKGQDFFIKYNDITHAPLMFKAEKHGLMTLSEVIPENIPKVIDQINSNIGSILILEYIEVDKGRNHDQTLLGRLVANLHAKTNTEYGLGEDNFIGSLVQLNGFYDDFSSFYMESRILPQVKVAIDLKLLDPSYFNKANRIGIVLENEIPKENPCLIHGDLWGGNFLRSSEGRFYLIDPSISYAHREMDIAMTMLFGGFSPNFYNSYNEINKLEKGWEERTGIFQLYYILVHLNLFGLSYKSSLDRIIDKWL